MGRLLGIACILLATAFIQAQAHRKIADVQHSMDDPDQISVMILLDASNSMQQRWDGYRKYNVATDLLGSMMEYYYRRYPNIQFAVRLFGHQHDMQYDRCDDTELIVHWTDRDMLEVADNMRSKEPKGWSPIQYSLEQALKDFQGIRGDRKKLILISDGGETCQGDPCAIATLMMEQGIEVEPFVLGMSQHFSLEEDLGCVGHYRHVSNAQEFNVAIYDIMEDFFRKTTVQVYYTDAERSYFNSEINFSFENLTYRLEMTDYVHSLDESKRTDTMEVLSSGQYRLTTHTFPPLMLKDFELNHQEHNVITVDAQEGNLKIEAVDGRGFAYYDVIVRDAETGQTVNVQQVGENRRYLTGTYDVEITSRPSTIYKKVEIKPDQETVLKVRRSGSFLFENRMELFGTLYHISEGGYEEVFVFDGLLGRRRVDILSGKYQFVYRPKQGNQTETITEEFSIKAGNVYHSIIK